MQRPFDGPRLTALDRRRTLAGHGPPRRRTRCDRRGAGRGRRLPGPADRARDGRLGRRRARHRGRRAGRPRRPRGPRAPGPAAAHAPRDPGPDRLDQPGRAQPRLPAPHRAARGRLRRGDASTRCCPPCRGPPGSSTCATTWPAASPVPSRSARTSSATLGPAGHPREGADATWMRSPCLGQCERAPAALFTIAGDPPDPPRHGPAGRRRGILRGLEDPGTADRSGLADHEDTRPQPGAPRGPAPVRPPGRRPGPAPPGPRRAHRPDQPHGLPRQRRLPRAPDGHRDGASSHRWRRSSPPRSRAAAAPRSPPGGSGPRWPRRPVPPSTSSATRTRPSRARSRTARSSRRIRSASSRR